MIKSFSRALRLYQKHFAGLMLLTLIQLLVTVACFVPMLGVFTGQAPYAALLTPVLFLLLVLPMRQNTARVFLALNRTGGLYIPGTADPERYGAKLAQGIKTGLCILLWSLPFLAATAYAVFVFKGDSAITGMDTFTLIRSIISLGGGELKRGAKLVILIYLATLLPILLGLAFHCGSRHFTAMGMKSRKRSSVMLTWCASLVTLVPFLAVAAVISLGYVQQLIDMVSNIMTSGLKLPPLGQNVYMLLAAAVVLLLPVLPLRALIIACRVHDLCPEYKGPGAQA